LFVLLIIFEMCARTVAPCYIGIPSGAFLGVLVSLAFALIRSPIIPGEIPPERHVWDDSTECSVSFVQTPLTLRTLLLCGLLTMLAGESTATAQTLQERFQVSPTKEAHRVFYPTDSQGQMIGEDVWVPLELLERLSRNINQDNPAFSQRWYITKAVYQGSLVRGASGTLECSDDFRVIYDVYLESPNAAIVLPNLPAVQGRFFWNSRPIQPIWGEESPSSTLSFAIENETPGKHTLEIALSPQVQVLNEDKVNQIIFAIPNVPHSTLRLNVPPDTPPISVPDALGAVTVNSALSPVVIAELGATNQFSLSWMDDPDRSGTWTSDVEQFFRIEIKPSQVELNALFRYRIDGTTRHVTIQTDPRWSRSGPFTCNEHAIASTGTFGSPTDSRHDRTRIEFQSPVSGTITLRASFVLRESHGNVNGIGNLPLPEFTALQSRITRSMLAVSVDPLLEVNFPTEGRSSGFEAGWHGQTALIPARFDNPIWDIAEMLINRNDTAVEYDLTRTEPTWSINIRTKKNRPSVAVTQSIQWDSHESRIHAVGELTSLSPVFRQHFSTDRPIQVESIEVRDSEGTPVESRFQQIAPERYLIFFKNHVTGKYTITIRGFFETDMREELPLQSVPTLTFDETLPTDHSHHFFRTSAVIAEIASEPEGWARSSAIPVAPESFVQPIPLGIWRKVEPVPLESSPSQLPYFRLRPNRPTVHSRTLLSLDVDSDGRWIMTLNFTGTITDGELKSLLFRWDERCEIIHSITPSTINWSLALSGGQPTLTLLWDEPIRGEQQFTLVASLNTTGMTVSLPNVFPLSQGIDQLESEIFVALPRKQENEPLSWELNMLEEVEEQSVIESNTEEQSVEEPTAFSSHSLYRVAGTDFAATNNRVEARLTALFYDIGFLINRDGTMLGSATIDLRNRGQDSFVLQMPPGYELIQISAVGIILDHTRLDDQHRWRINIGTSDYLQRLNILFRASLKPPLRQWNRGQVAATLQCPILEGVTVQETLWTAAFEGTIPTLHVKTTLDSKETYDLKDHTPLSGMEAALSLVGMNLVREHNLLQTLRSLPAFSRQDEMQRWFWHWSNEWNMVADKVDFQMSNLSSQNIRPQLIVRSAASPTERTESTGTVRSFLATIGMGTQEALRDIKRQIVQDQFDTSINTLQQQSAPVLNSQVYWQGRVSEKMQYLFGTEEGGLHAIHLTSQPDIGDWADWFSKHLWLGICLALLIPILVLLSVRWVHLMELWLQFPHFWGMTLGVLLWALVPESFIGVIIITLTLISFLRPSWLRHRLMEKQF
jgi:hypothetical protein